MTKTYKQYARQAMCSAKKVEAELVEMMAFKTDVEHKQEVRNAIGSVRVLLVALGNIQFDADHGEGS